VALAPLPVGADKRRTVQAMFDRIAPRYDLLNRLLTGGLDQRWRRRTLALARVAPGERVLDLACGTGDLARLARERGARVLGVDFARVMLRHARTLEPGIDWVQGDAEALPVPDGAVDVVTCGFALRNFVALDAVLDELYRVLAPGGRIALIDVDRPAHPLVRWAHSVHFDRLVPRVGAWFGEAAAYRYLPESTAYLPPRLELLARLGKAGFAEPTHHGLLLGTAQILTGVRP